MIRFQVRKERKGRLILIVMGLYACTTTHKIICFYHYIGMEKINFSGGEPFIHQKGRYLGQLVRFCKKELGLASVSIVSNGSLITEDWFIEYGSNVANSYSAYINIRLKF